MPRKIEVLKRVTYQFTKDTDLLKFVDAKRVDITKSLLNANIDETDVDSGVGLPDEVLGVGVDWFIGGFNVRLFKGTVEIIQDVSEEDVIVPGIEEGELIVDVFTLTTDILGDVDVEETYVETSPIQTLADAEVVVAQIVTGIVVEPEIEVEPVMENN